MKKAEFELKKYLINLEIEKDKKQHKNHMRELDKQIEIEKMKFENALQLQRIRSAEIRKSQERNSFMKKY